MRTISFSTGILKLYNQLTARFGFTTVAVYNRGIKSGSSEGNLISCKLHRGRKY